MLTENNPKVAIVRVGNSIAKAISHGLDLIGGIDARQGERVVIKPNLCHPSPAETGRTTDVRIVKEIADRCSQFGKDSIYIVETDNFSASADTTFKRLGYTRLKEKHAVQLLNLSREPSTTIKVGGKFFDTMEIPEFLLAPNYFITVSKLKVHLHELYTGAWKNQWGCIIQREKRCFHPFLNEALADMNSVWKPRLCIVDGIIGMEGCGPIDGVPKTMNLLIFGKNLLAVDSVCCNIMGIDPYNVPHLRYAHEHDFGEIDLNKIQILGEPIEKVSGKFALPPNHAVKSMRWGLRLGRFPPPIINIGLASFNFGNNYAGKEHSTRKQRQREANSTVGLRKAFSKLWTTKWNV